MRGLFTKQPRFGLIFDALLPLIATLAALAIGAVMLALLGANPATAYGAMLHGAFGSTNAVADTLVKSTPLLLVGLGICIAFRGGVINIGGEGQLIVGALAATAFSIGLRDLPGWFLLPMSMIMGALAGAFWGGIPGVLKAKLG